MHGYRFGAASIAGIVFVSMGAPVRASISGSAHASASGPVVVGTSSQSSTNSQFTVNAERAGSRGAHGYSELDVDIFGGVVTGRNHACVGPSTPGGGDTATADASLQMFSETMTVTSDTLPIGTMVSIMVCVSISSEMHGSITEQSLIGTSYSRTTISAGFGASSLTGTHLTDQYWENPRGTFDDFLGQTGNTVTASQMFLLNKKVGDVLPFAMSADSETKAASAYLAGSFPMATGSAGFAITFGLMSITDGAHLEWRGLEWTGSCGDSSVLIPPNPLEPTPGAAAAFAIAGLFTGARRRR